MSKMSQLHANTPELTHPDDTDWNSPKPKSFRRCNYNSMVDGEYYEFVRSDLARPVTINSRSEADEYERGLRRAGFTDRDR
jgi:hypothetical protein